MPEENQIQTPQQTTPTDNLNSMRERLAAMRSFRNDAKLKKAQESQNTMDMNSNNMYQQSLNVLDPELSKKYHMASQSSAIAPIIKTYAESQWNDWSDLNTTQQIMSEYFKLNPDDDTFNKIMEFAQSDRDPEDFWVEMWWLQPTAWDKAVNWAEDNAKSFLSFFETWWDFVRNLVNGSLEELEQGTIFNPSETDYTNSAKENFAEMKYGKNYYSLTPEQKAEADYIVSTQEWYDMYKPSVQRATSRLAETWLDAFFTVIAPRMKAWFSIAWNTPWTDILMEWLWTATEFWWYIINALPILYQYRESLQTEEEKRERDQFVGSLWLMKLLQKRNWRDKWWTTRDSILSEINPETMIKEFQKRVLDAPKDIKEMYNNYKNKPKEERKWKSTLEELRANDKNWKEETENIIRRVTKKTVKWDSLQESSRKRLKVAKWLSDIEPEQATSYKAVSEALRRKGNQYKKEMDDVLKKDTKTYTREEIMREETNDKTGQETKTDIFERMIDKLIEANENRPNERSTYEFYRDKIINWEITLKELNDIVRDFNTEFSDNMFKENGWEKNWLNAADWRRLRTSWKIVIRRLWEKTWIPELSYDNLESMDRQYSSNIDAQYYIDKIYNAKADYDATRHVKTEWESIWEAFWMWTKAFNSAKNFDVEWFKNAFSKWTPEEATFEELEMELPSSIARIRELRKSIEENDKSLKQSEKLDFNTEEWWEWFEKMRWKDSDYLIMSVENPYGKTAKPEINAKNTAAFRERMDKEWIAYKGQKWVYGWDPEQSQIIAIDKAGQRSKILKYAEENAPQEWYIVIKWGKAYRFGIKDWKPVDVNMVDLRKSKTNLEAEGKENYSEIDWKKYVLPLYWPEEIKLSTKVNPEAYKDFLSIFNDN